MQNRRDMLVSASAGGAAGALALLASPLHAQGAPALDPVRDWGFHPPGPPGPAAAAAGPLRAEEVATAFRLLFAAKGSTPLDVARYFQALRTTQPPIKEGFYWNEEWGVPRPNPVVVGFFSMTNTLPSKGDETPWCAAFVNFCLAASGRQLLWSAWALDFLKYGTKTDAPAPGDIVVFSRPGGGHVAFFLANETNADGKVIGVKVLGGNQGGGSPGANGAVSERTIKLGTYAVQGYRKIPA